MLKSLEALDASYLCLQIPSEFPFVLCKYGLLNDGVERLCIEQQPVHVCRICKDIHNKRQGQMANAGPYSHELTIELRSVQSDSAAFHCHENRASPKIQCVMLRMGPDLKEWDTLDISPLTSEVVPSTAQVDTSSGILLVRMKIDM